MTPRRHVGRLAQAFREIVGQTGSSRTRRASRLRARRAHHAPSRACRIWSSCRPAPTRWRPWCAAAPRRRPDRAARGGHRAVRRGDPRAGGVLIVLTRMNRILDIDLPNRTATVEAGCVNLAISRAVMPRGFFFAPDPASQQASTIGGNVAENAGGPHCLKYGATTNHVLGPRSCSRRRDRPVRRPAGGSARLRPAGGLRRVGRHARHLHRGDRATAAAPAGGEDHPGGVSDDRRREQRGLRHHRARHHPRRAGDDRPGNHAGRRGVRERGLSAGRGGRPADRAGGPGRRRSPPRPSRSSRRVERTPASTSRWRRPRTSGRCSGRGASPPRARSGA